MIPGVLPEKAYPGLLMPRGLARITYPGLPFPTTHTGTNIDGGGGMHQKHRTEKKGATHVKIIPMAIHSEDGLGQRPQSQSSLLDLWAGGGLLRPTVQHGSVLGT